MQDVSGELRDAHEADDEASIKYVKKELPTMRHTDEFLATVQRKQLTTSVFSWLNSDNPKSCQKQYERNYNLKVYRCQDDQDPLNLLQENNVLTGGVDHLGNLFFCVEDSSGIDLWSLIFDDEEGHWCFNLWYSKVRLGDAIHHCENRKEVLKKCSDYFIMLPKATAEQSPLDHPVQHRTVICRSWRIRDESGSLQLPVPRRDVLHYKG